MENTLVPGGLAEWVIELVPTFDVRIWTVHTLIDVFARMTSVSPFRSIVTNETVLAARNRSAMIMQFEVNTATSCLQLCPVS